MSNTPPTGIDPTVVATASEIMLPGGAAVFATRTFDSGLGDYVWEVSAEHPDVPGAAGPYASVGTHWLGTDAEDQLYDAWYSMTNTRMALQQATEIKVIVEYNDGRGHLVTEHPLDPPLSFAAAAARSAQYETEHWAAVKTAKPSGDAGASPLGGKPLPGNSKHLQPITRPDGQLYYPRRYKGTTDVLFVRKAVQAGMNVLLIGAPGDGKTAMLEAALGLITTVSCDEGTTRADFVGEGYFKPDGSTGYHWGPAAQALTHQHDSQCEDNCNLNVLYVDEVNAARPSEIKILHPMGDDRKVVHTIEHGAIAKSPDFRLVASINPDEVGTYLSPALRNRFRVVINLTPDYSIAKKLGVPDVIINSAIKLQKQKAAGEPIAALPSMRDLLAFRDVANAFDMATAWENLISSADELAQQQWIEALSNDAGMAENIKPLAMLAEYMQ